MEEIKVPIIRVLQAGDRYYGGNQSTHDSRNKDGYYGGNQSTHDSRIEARKSISLSPMNLPRRRLRILRSASARRN